MKRVMTSLSFELYEGDWWKMCNTDNIIKRHLRGCFSYEIFLREEILLGNIKGRSLFRYVECDIEVSENLREAFANFPPILKNINVGRDEKGPFKKNYDNKEGILTQTRRMLISSYFLEKGANITPLRLLFLDLGLVYRKHLYLVQYTPMKCFNNFVQSAVNARGEEDENPKSFLVAETKKILVNSSYGYQIMDRSRHRKTKFLSDEKTHSVINSKLCKRLGYISDQLYEVERVK